MLKDLSLEAYITELSSDSHVGGGSVAALNAAIATALVSMVANLTKDKEAYAEVSAEMRQLVDDMQVLNVKFIDYIDKDAQSFNGVLKAFKLPKNTEAEKKLRSQAISEGYKEAIAVPLALAKDAYQVFDLIDLVLAKGNRKLASDAIIAALSLRNAILMALLNVEINLSALKDEDYKTVIKAEVEALKEKAKRREQAVVNSQQF